MRTVQLYKSLMEHVRRHGFGRTWPLCDLCTDLTGRATEVYRVNIEEVGRKHAVVRVECHEKEDVVRCEFDWDHRPEELKWSVRAVTFFPKDAHLNHDQSRPFSAAGIAKEAGDQ